MLAKRGRLKYCFFHASIKIREYNQNIDILSDNAESLSSDADMVKAAANYFEKSLSAESCNSDEEFFQYIDKTIDEDDNVDLCADPSAAEIREIVLSMNEDSAPGPDGFGGFFYKKYWHIIQHDVIEAVQEFFKGNELSRSYTCSNLTLIPKNQNLKQFADLRPISVSNFCYKIISRVMLNRLNKVLPKTIAPEQSGFVPNRTIHDNIALALELTQDLNKKSRGGNIILQIDMEKAYDLVEWPF